MSSSMSSSKAVLVAKSQSSQRCFSAAKKRRGSGKTSTRRRVVRASSELDLSIFNLDSAAEAGVIILLVRIITLGGGKAALSKQLEEQIERAKERNIDISDLYYSEDQGEDAWYLIGDWRPPKKGDLKFGDGRTKEEIKYRIRWAEAMKVADENEIEYEDLNEFASAKKFVELRKRIREKTKDESFDVM